MTCVGNQLSLEHGAGDPRINEYWTSLRYTIDFRLTLGWRQYSISNKIKEAVFLFIVLAWHEVGETKKWPNIFNPSSFPTWLSKVGDVLLVIENNVSSKVILNYTEPMFLGNLQLRSSFHLMSNTSPASQLEISILLNSSLSKPASCDSYKFRF